MPECMQGELPGACTERAMEQGYGLGQDPLPLLDDACADGAQDACERAQVWRFAEDGAPAGLVTQIQLDDLGMRCGNGQAKACAHLAKIHADGPVEWRDRSRASMLQDQACRAGDGRACWHMAGQAELRADTAARTELLDLGCAAGDAQSCVDRAGLATPEQAVEWLAKACAAGHTESCPAPVPEETPPR